MSCSATSDFSGRYSGNDCGAPWSLRRPNYRFVRYTLRRTIKPGDLRSTSSLTGSIPEFFWVVGQQSLCNLTVCCWCRWKCFGRRKVRLLSCTDLSVVWSAVVATEHSGLLSGYIRCCGRRTGVRAGQLGGCPDRKWLWHYKKSSAILCLGMDSCESLCEPYTLGESEPWRNSCCAASSVLNKLGNMSCVFRQSNLHQTTWFLWIMNRKDAEGRRGLV